MQEYLVTAQGYQKQDTYKQLMLLHNTYIAIGVDEAMNMFRQEFDVEYTILKIFSVVKIFD
jgi:hypothetical protein